MKINSSMYEQIRLGFLHFRRAYVQQHQTERGWQRQLAFCLGVSPTYVSLIANDQSDQPLFDHIGLRTWQKIYHYFQFKPASCSVVPVRIYKQIQVNVLAAQRRGQLLGLDGETGIGKTTALKDLAQHLPHSVYIAASSQMGTADVLQLATQGWGLTWQATKKLPAVLTQLAQQFRLMHPFPLLIIDDAILLRGQVLQKIVQFYQSMQGRLGLVLAGQGLRCRLWAQAAKNQAYADIYKQAANNTLLGQRATREDVRAICRQEGLCKSTQIEQVWQVSQGQLSEVQHVIRQLHHAG